MRCEPFWRVAVAATWRVSKGEPGGACPGAVRHLTDALEPGSIGGEFEQMDAQLK
jgi:hypothetical protein